MYQKTVLKGIGGNQYNIYYEELESIIEIFRNINFKKNLERYRTDLTIFPPDVTEALNNANGLNIEMLFLFKIYDPTYLRSLEQNETEKAKLREQHFRFWMNVFPLLIREYRNLVHFLNEIKNDGLLTSEYRSKFYKKNSI
jgi:hypothetical protein